MTTGAQQLEIRRVYSSGAVKAATVAVGDGARAQFSVLGVLYLLLAGVWIYVAWWPADRLIGANLATTGLGCVSAMGGLNGLFAAAPPDLADPAPPEGTQAALVAVEDTPPTPQGADIKAIEAEYERTMSWLGGTMEVWLAISTIVGGWLALCGGAAVAGLPIVDAARRRPVLILAAMVVGLAAIGIATQLWKGGLALGALRTATEIAFVGLVMLLAWLLAVALPRRSAGLAAAALTLALIGGIALTGMKLGTGYPSAAPRIAAVVGMLIAVLTGVVAAHRSVGLDRAAVILVLLAAIATLAGLGLADSLGGVHTHAATPATYAAIGAAQAAWAGVLLGARALGWR